MDFDWSNIFLGRQGNIVYMHKIMGSYEWHKSEWVD